MPIQTIDLSRPQFRFRQDNLFANPFGSIVGDLTNLGGELTRISEGRRQSEAAELWKKKEFDTEQSRWADQQAAASAAREEAQSRWEAEQGIVDPKSPYKDAADINRRRKMADTERAEYDKRYRVVTVRNPDGTTTTRTFDNSTGKYLEEGGATGAPARPGAAPGAALWKGQPIEDKGGPPTWTAYVGGGAAALAGRALWKKFKGAKAPGAPPGAPTGAPPATPPTPPPGTPPGTPPAAPPAAPPGTPPAAPPGAPPAKPPNLWNRPRQLPFDKSGPIRNPGGGLVRPAVGVTSAATTGYAAGTGIKSMAGVGDNPLNERYAALDQNPDGVIDAYISGEWTTDIPTATGRGIANLWENTQGNDYRYRYQQEATGVALSAAERSLASAGESPEAIKYLIDRMNTVAQSGVDQHSGQKMDIREVLQGIKGRVQELREGRVQPGDFLTMTQEQKDNRVAEGMAAFDARKKARDAQEAQPRYRRQ